MNSQGRYVTFATVSQQVLPANPRRYSLTIFSTSTLGIFFNLHGPCALNQCMYLPAGTLPLYLSRDTIGDAIEQPLNALAQNSSGMAFIIESFS